MPTNNFSYALADPLSVILDKSCQDFQRADFFKVIEQKQIERITFHYTALDGKLKELSFPFTNRLQAEKILTEGERVDGSSLFKGMVDPAVSDLYVVPEYKTAFLNPFDERSLDFICRYLTGDGKRVSFALDNILAKAYQLFYERTGLELFALGELEFFLITERKQSAYPLQSQQGYHEAQPFMKSGEILSEMVRYISQITGAVKYAHSEVGSIEKIQSSLDEIRDKSAEQLEVEFLSKPVQEMADVLVLGRWLIRNVAYKHGCIAIFTPKIEEGAAGNGFHFHFELKEQGRNVMLGSGGGLSESALRLIGGLCEYADSLTAFGNTVSSSYLRLVPDQEAPTRIFWGDLNREAMIRLPLGWNGLNNLSRILNPQEEAGIKGSESCQTVELRTPDGSALIHLLLAGIVMAAEWAFKNNLSLELAEKFHVKGDMRKDNNFINSFPALPGSCVESSRILLKKRDLYEREGVFPASVIEYIAKLLQAENDEEMSEKFDNLSKNDRLCEIRKIMHKDLHRH
ncbi:MAG: glutamine synthetase [Candidatus Aminicenantes bacterium]|nr:glutamine synthetase [Candidatus Aminicenantes bacterium]